jgi:protein-tyrosine phosphatase
MSSSELLRRLMLSRVSDAIEEDPVEIFPCLFLGSLQAALDTDKLREKDIGFVLTVAGKLSVRLPTPEFTHKEVDIADHPAADILSIIPECLSFIDKAMNNGDNGAEKEHSSQYTQRRILVHCASGISRSVSICCAWFMMRHALSFDESMERIRAVRPRANPNPGFRAQLQLLDKCSGDVERASALYKEHDGGNVMTVIARRREKCNELHSAADDIEVNIKRKGLCADACEVSEWSQQLNSLLVQLDIISSAADTQVVVDKPSESIRRAATAKIVRLLEDLASYSQRKT